MYNNFFVAMILFLMSTLTVGCSSTKDVHVRGYIKEKKRVDQELKGNAGFLLGTPKGKDLKSGRETRKVYVLEVTKEAERLPDNVYTFDRSSDDFKPSSASVIKEPTRQVKEISTAPPKISLPSFSEYDQKIDFSEKKDVSSKSATTNTIAYKEYVVQKGDTLQKISKKFYDSYSKWSKIYDANKSKISNPDKIKPGITLNIPVN